MGSRSFIVFLIAASVKLAVITWAALWPLQVQHALTELKTLSGLARLYTVADSNLDIWLLSGLYTLVLVLLLWQAATPTSQRHLRGMAYTPPYQQVSNGIFWASLFFQLFLMAKAVAVAVMAKELVLPPAKPAGVCGLLGMYTAIVAALVACWVENAAGQRVVVAGRRRLERARESSLREPLLFKEKLVEGEEGQHHATILALLKLSVPDAPILLVAFTAGAVAALGQALIPYYTGRIIDYASIDPEPSKFHQTTLKLLGVAAGCALFTGLRGGLFTICMTRLNVRLRTHLFASLMRQEVGFFDTVKTGDITSRLSADTTAVSDQISLNLNVMLRSLTQAAMVLAFMFSASWRLTVVTFIIIPCVLVICKVYGEYYRKMSKKVQTELAEANSVAEEAISTMTTVKAHAAEDSTEAAYAVKLKQFYDLQTRVAGAYAAYMSTNTFLAATVVAVVLYYGGSLVLAGAMSAGSLVSFMLYQQSLSGAFQALGDVFSALAAAVGAADKVVELMHRRPRLGRGGTLAPHAFSGKIALQDVHFSYPARPALRVLSGLSVTVQPGEIVALVGPSGGGKSSIVKLVERFYLPSEGRVLIDDRDVGDYDPKWLKRHVALVSQEPVLYARSIRRNIVYGMEEEDGVPPDQVLLQQEIEEAARLANAHEFITALPDGYATECGEKGVQLSGGQKQRIAIARALIRRPTVLLLDEATSALDADSEAVVQEALDRTMKNRTVLVIAHRLSTVQDAHRIVVVQHGSVAESGTHEDLLERGGVYSALVRRQMARASSSASIRRALGSTPSLDEI